MTDKLEKRIAKLEKENTNLRRYIGGLDTDLFFLQQRVETLEDEVSWASGEIDNIYCVLSDYEGKE